MSVRRLCERINDFSFGLISEGAALDANIHIVEETSATASRISWRSPSKDIALIYGDPASVQEYLSILRDRNYSFLLNDGAIVQSSFAFDRDEVVKHRLAYYSCPFELRGFTDSVSELGILDTIEEFLMGDAHANIRLRPSLRFDYDPASAREYHPASHMTFASNIGRVPLSSPFSFESFVKFIFENFYEDHWKDRKIFRDWREVGCRRCLSEHDAARAHVAVP